MADAWKYILINGKSKSVEVQNPTYEKGKLTEIKDLRPFDDKNEDGSRKEPTIEDANRLKRSLYSNFFKKPFKNVLILTHRRLNLE
jgi:hypothetical protein